MKTILLLVWSLAFTQCQLISVSLPGVSHIASGGNEVFASNGYVIFRYSMDLNQQQNVFLPNNDKLVELIATPDGLWSVTCVSSGPCYILSGSHIPVEKVDDLYGQSGIFDGLTLFTAIVSDRQTVFAGSYGRVNDNAYDSNMIRFIHFEITETYR